MPWVVKTEGTDSLEQEEDEEDGEGETDDKEGEEEDVDTKKSGWTGLNKTEASTNIESPLVSWGIEGFVDMARCSP